MRTKRPTQKEVALRAGVSQAVVSQVLNNRDGAVRIGAETRERVLSAMRELGYVPNAAARSLAGGQNRILGVFTYEPVFPTSTRDFFYPFLEGIEEEAAQLDYDLLLHTRAASDGGRRIYQNGNSRLQLADGTLLLGFLNDERRAELARLLDEGHPTVFIGRREVPGHNLPYVGGDYARATGNALDALHQAGHTHVMYLGEPGQYESAVDREAGYRSGSKFGGRRAEVVRLAEVTKDAVQGAHQRGVTGILFENDRLAHVWIRVARDLGLSAPQDFSFAVLGDPLEERELPAGWAHFRIPRREMGRAAVRLLVDLLSGHPAASISLPCTWVPGTSIAPPATVGSAG